MYLFIDILLLIVYLNIYSFNYLFIYLLIYSFIPLPIHSLIHLALPVLQLVSQCDPLIIK